MNPQLLLRLPEHPEQSVHWLVCSRENQNLRDVEQPSEDHILASGCWLSIAEFTDHFTHTTFSDGKDGSNQLISALEVTVLVPVARVTLHTLDVQGRLTPAVRQSLGWRLEEELGEDVENLHFAIVHHGDNQAHIAVTGKSDMAQWQDWLNSAGVTSKCWIPDALALSVNNDECRILNIDNLIIARYGQWQIAACDPGWLPVFLDVLRKDRPQMVVQGSAQASAQTGPSPLAYLTAGIGNIGCNLLQGEWQPASPWRQHLRPWRSVMAMGCVFLALLMVNNLLNIHRLEQQADVYLQQAHSIYQDLFPGERVVRLDSQMRQKLAALQQPDARRESLLTTLASITPLLNDFPELKTLTMDYDNTRHHLRIQAQANNFDLFTRLRERFTTEVNDGKLKLTIEALEQTGDKVTGELVISGDLS